MWIYWLSIAIFVGGLLGFGMLVDRRRRGSTRGTESRAERFGGIERRAGEPGQYSVGGSFGGPPSG